MNADERQLFVLSVLNAFNIIRMELEDTNSDEENIQVLLSRTSARRRRGDAVIRVKRYVEDVVHNLPARQFRAHFRMTRSTFEKLLHIVRNELKATTLNHRPMGDVEKALLAVIWLLANQESFRLINNTMH